MAKKRNQMIKKKEWLNFDNAAVFIIILLVISVLRAIVSGEAGTAGSKVDLAEEAAAVLSKITDERTPISLLKSNELLEEKVEQLEKMDYGEIKSMLGIKSDFCIYFEDISGNAITIDGISPGIGSNRILINGGSCE